MSFRELPSAERIYQWWELAYWFKVAPIGVRSVVIASIVLGCSFFIPGFYYWMHTTSGWSNCVYGGAECASSFVGYLAISLTIIGVLVSLRALLDTADAVRYAARTLEHQQKGILATQRCGHKNCHESSRRKDIFVVAVGRDPTESFDPDDDGLQYEDFSSPVPVDFLSVGLGPVLSCTLRMKLHPLTQGAERIIGTISVGTLTGNDKLHIDIRILNQIATGYHIVFDEAKAERIGIPPKVGELEYHPSNERLVPQVTIEGVDIKAASQDPGLPPAPQT